MSINSLLEKIVKKAYDNTLVPGLQATKSITIHSIARGGFVVATGKNTGTKTDYIVNALVSNVTLNDISGSGGILEAGDLGLSIGRTQTVPSVLTTDDEITFVGEKYSIISVRKTDVGNTDLIWFCFIRRK